jgi:epoxyqueuosine reductase QueG
MVEGSGGIQMKLDDHPTVKKYLKTKKKSRAEVVDYQWLRKIVLNAGADDAGFIEIDREELKDQKDDIQRAFPGTKCIISYVCRLNVPQLQSVDRSLADVEFIALEGEMERVSRTVVKVLRKNGIRSVVPSENFPMDMLKWPGKMWTVSHKPIAAAAGLGHIGHHRLLIHPVYGSYICIGTMLIDVAVSKYDCPIEFNPCIECKLCVSVCPTGAISKTGEFEFFACLVHTYRDRLGGFINWVEEIVTSTSMDEYREKRDDSETMAVWQSLTHGGGYRCGYCMSVCPAGEDVIGSYIEDKKGYVSSVVKPLKDREEPVYVLSGSESESSVPKRFSHKTMKRVG